MLDPTGLEQKLNYPYTIITSLVVHDDSIQFYQVWSIIEIQVSWEMELHCVVRRDIALLTQRKCNLSDATLKPSSFVDIKSNPELASKFTQLQTRDISTQCTSCDVSAIEVIKFGITNAIIHCYSRCICKRIRKAYF